MHTPHAGPSVSSQGRGRTQHHAHPPHPHLALPACPVHPTQPHPSHACSLKGSIDLEHLKRVVDSVMVPEFVPKEGVKISSDPKEAEKEKNAPPPADDDEVCYRRSLHTRHSQRVTDPPDEAHRRAEQICSDIIKSLPAPSSLAGYRMSCAEFEKDDDSNFHIDFISRLLHATRLHATRNA